MIPVSSQLQYIDSHTGGEPTRVIHAGFPELDGATMAEKRDSLRDGFDWIRSASINEPRGSDAVVGALLLPPIDAANDSGVIFFNNVGYINMCVHGTIGLVVTLSHMGHLIMGDVARIETAVGIVEATLHEDGNSVTVANVPSYRSRKSVTLDVPNFGKVTGDVAWGGNWFFLVDKSGLKVSFDNISELTRFCLAVQAAITDKGITGVDEMPVDHIEVFSAPGPSIKADSQNFVLCPGGAYDRSPCGTGTSAKLACLYADGKLKPGDVWRQAGIVGSVFTGKIGIKADTDAVVPGITGSAYVTGEGTLMLDPADPFRYGIGHGLQI